MKDSLDLASLVSNKRGKINSKNKGNTFQRNVAKILNTHFGTTDFMPTPGSGAFATTHKLPAHLQIYGDLITPKNFAFTIEAKKGYNKENLGSIFNPKSQLISFWKQTLRDSNKAGRSPLVIFQQDRKNTLAILEWHLVDNITFDKEIRCIAGGDAFTIVSLEELLACTPRPFWFQVI